MLEIAIIVWLSLGAIRAIQTHKIWSKYPVKGISRAPLYIAFTVAGPLSFLLPVK